MTSEAAFAPIDPSGAVLGDEVYTVLGEAILDGRLRPGERLRDVELAARLGVSRTPVREALQRLQRCRLVEVAAGRWTRVTEPDAAALAATHEFLVYTFGNAVRMALRRCTAAQLQTMVAGADAMTAASDLDDDELLFQASTRFFQSAIDAAGNTTLSFMLDEAEFALRRNLRGWRPHIDDVAERHAMYAAFREAVAAREGDAAERLLRLQHGHG